MADNLRCPHEECGFWGIPLEKLPVLSVEAIRAAAHECVLWHGEEVKCIRDPRFSQDPEAEDLFDPADNPDSEDEMPQTGRQLRLAL